MFIYLDKVDTLIWIQKRSQRCLKMLQSKVRHFQSNSSKTKTIYIHINFTLTMCQICTHVYAPKEQKHQRGSKVSIKMNLVLWDYKV